MSQTASIELRVSTLEEFLSVLQRRQQDAAIHPPIYSPLPRRAVCVQTRLYQSISSENFGLPERTRYILATFAYGADVVSFRSTTSSSLEMGPPAEDTKKLGDAQMKEYERIKHAIEQKITELEIAGHVPVIEGHLSLPGAGSKPPGASP